MVLFKDIKIDRNGMQRSNERTNEMIINKRMNDTQQEKASVTIAHIY